MNTNVGGGGHGQLLGRSFLKPIGTLIVFVIATGGATSLDTIPPFTKFVCINSPLANWDFYTQNFCSMRKLKTSEVTPVIDNYIQRSSGDLWRVHMKSDDLSPDVKQWQEANSAEMDSIQWAERIGSIHLARGVDKELNVFSVRLRIFGGPQKETAAGPVIERDEFITMAPRMYGDRPRVQNVRIGGATQPFTWDHPQMTFLEDSDTYVVPFRGPSARVVDMPLHARQGTHLRALCQLKVDNEWWTSTREGWVDNSDVVKGNQEFPNFGACESYHIDDAHGAARDE